MNLFCEIWIFIFSNVIFFTFGYFSGWKNLASFFQHNSASSQALKCNPTPQRPVVSACNLKINNRYFPIEYIFGDFFEQSWQQLLYPKETLLIAARFVMEERDEYDPELIQFVRSLIKEPPEEFSKPHIDNFLRKDFSQLEQSAFIDEQLGHKEHGFFVEAGAYDGETFSNSLFFERERKWTGLLVEVMPSHFERLLAKNRRVFAINACLTAKRPIIGRFRIGELFSAQSKRKKRQFPSPGTELYGSYVNIPCFSLNTILRAIGIRRVDYFSLDIEGGELEVLQNLDFKTVAYQALTVEYNGDLEKYEKLTKLFETHGFNGTKNDGQDLYMLKGTK